MWVARRGMAFQKPQAMQRLLTKIVTMIGGEFD